MSGKQVYSACGADYALINTCKNQAFINILADGIYSCGLHSTNQAKHGLIPIEELKNKKIIQCASGIGGNHALALTGTCIIDTHTDR